MGHTEGGGGSRSTAPVAPVGGTAAAPFPFLLLLLLLLLLCSYACPVSKRAIRPSSSTVKSHRVRISPQVSLR